MKNKVQIRGKEKSKAGYYISNDVLGALEERFLRIKLDKGPVKNKSELVELALVVLFEELDKDEEILHRIG